MNRMLASLTALLALACVAPSIEDEVATTNQEIVGGTLASPWHVARAAFVRTQTSPDWGKECTATIIGPRTVLTAAHCEASTQSLVYFFTSAAGYDESSARGVTSVALRPGVDPATNHLIDSNGNWADVAVLTLDADIPSSSRTADLDWQYPAGSDDVGRVVGAGNHDSIIEPGELRQRAVETRSPSQGNRYFLLDEYITNAGDSGGSFYYLAPGSGRTRLLGVESGACTSGAGVVCS